MDQDQLIISMYKNNISILKISNVLKIPQIDVYECLIKNGYDKTIDKNYERDNKICNLYTNGIGIKKIASTLSIDRHTVTHILKKYNVYKRNKNVNNFSMEKRERNEKIIELYEQGLSSHDIANFMY